MDILTGKTFSSIWHAYMDLFYWSFRSSSKRGGYGVKGVWMAWGISFFQPSTIITLSEYIKIWCNIQVMKYRFPTTSLSPKNLKYPKLIKLFFSRKPAPKSVLIARGQYQLKQQDEFDDNCIYLPGGLTYRYSYLLV